MPTLPHPPLSHMLAHPLEAVNQVSISACLYRRKPNGKKGRRLRITFILRKSKSCIQLHHVNRQVSELHQFQATLAAATSTPPATLEAYSSGVSVLLEALSGAMLELEAELARQQQTTTLLSTLDALQPWLDILAQFSTTHQVKPTVLRRA